MGSLKEIFSAAVDKLFPPQGRSYMVVLDREGTRHFVPMDKNYTPENPPPKNPLDGTSMEFAARLTP